MTANDTQVAGRHYTSKTIQPWDAMEAWMSREEFIGYLRGNIVKYVARYRDKGGVEDLRKARHYLDKLIEVLIKGADDSSQCGMTTGGIAPAANTYTVPTGVVPRTGHAQADKT